MATKNTKAKTAANKPVATKAPAQAATAKKAGEPAGTKHIADAIKAMPSRRVWPD